MSTPAAIGRVLRSRGTMEPGVLTSALTSILRGPDELPSVLPRPAVLDLKHDDEQAHALDGPRHYKRAGVDRAKTDRPDELQRNVFCTLVVAGDESVQARAVDRGIGVPGGERVVQSLHHAHLRMALEDLLGVGEAFEPLPRVLGVDPVRHVQNYLPVYRGAEAAKYVAELVGGHREDDQVRVLDGFNVGTCAMSARGPGRVGCLLGSGRSERDAVPGAHTGCRQRLADVPRADDRYFHVS